MGSYNVIRHYASPYYDPVKAHEYYEEHKQLKGRKSTSGLNDTGREAAAYIKKQLKEERDTKTETSKNQRDSGIKQHSENMASKISTLSARIKSLSGANKKARASMIRAEIATLREENAKKKEELRAAFAASKEEYQNDYETKYEEELEKLKADSSMQKTKTSTTKSTKKSTKTSTQTNSNRSLDEIRTIMNDYKKNSK